MAIQIQSEKRWQLLKLLSNVDVGSVSLCQHTANWTSLTSIKSGVNEMAAQIVHAIVLPEGTDLEILKDIYGDQWFETLRTDTIENEGTSIAYVQVQKSAFASLNEPVSITDTIQIITGELKETEKADGMMSMPVATQVTVTTNVSEMVSDEMYKFQSILWASLSQSSVKPAQRKTVIMGALNAFWDFLNTFLDTLGSQTVTAKCDGAEPYGQGELFSRVISEIRRLEKRITTNDTGGIDTMDDAKLTELTASIQSLTEKMESLETRIAAAEKTETVEVPETVEATPIEVEKTEDVEAEKTEPVEDNRLTEALAALATITEKLEALDAKVVDTAAKTDALTHITKSPSIAEDAVPVTKAAKSRWDNLPMFRS